ncbi:hypothetical protein F5884DRAFT_471821 [Xylogone sp. PMI_703]|nr:hypothetical protein F5884DRAFT_471821 [Xylogone sp. PMI_703]
MDSEDLNQPTDERRGALARIQKALRIDVSRHFWAACHLCDINSLQKLAGIVDDGSTVSSVLVYGASTSTDVIVRGWNPLKTTATYHGISASRRQLSHGGLSAKEKAICRHNNRCVLTGARMFDVAHIYPWDLLCQASDSAEQLKFWNTLKIYFPDEKINSWRSAVQRNRGRYGETTSNLLCLNPLAHSLWSVGAFALKPMSISEDMKTLNLQFFWQAEYSEDLPAMLALPTVPSSTKDLDSSYGSFLSTESGYRIESGDIFILSSTNPDVFPLPSFELLEMQWFICRMLALAGPFKVEVLGDESEVETDEEEEEDYDYAYVR